MANERRLIDANALPVTTLTDGGYWTKDVVYKKNVDAALTVDAVEVVRCRDCKHMIPQSHMRYCTVWHGANGMGDEGFCNYGERRRE